MTEGRSSTRTPQALVDVDALVLGVSLEALGTLALVVTRQIYTESPSSAGSLVIALVHVDTLQEAKSL